MLFYLIAFTILLGPLVFVHEFGHFLFAKLFNVRVDTFSMGFGPKIFRRQWGETEYCLSAIPLGGYVKLFGQDPTEAVPNELKHRSLNTQTAWKRFLIFIGGPLFNFLFAILVFSVMLMVGEPHLSPEVARVVPQSQAYVAGFRSGDLITAVDRTVVTKFDEVAQMIAEAPNKQLTFRVKHRSENGAASSKEVFREVKITPTQKQGFGTYGETVEMGEIDGLSTFGRHPVVGVSHPTSVAAKAGFKTGDEILAINDRKVKSFEDLLQFAEEERNRGVTKFVFSVAQHEMTYWNPEARVNASVEPTTQITLPSQDFDKVGLYSSELFVSNVMKSSPAEKAGLLQGDRLVSINGAKVMSFQQLRDRVQDLGEADGMFKLVYERAGKTTETQIIPTVSETRDAVGRETKQFLMGVYPYLIQSEPTYFVERIFNPFTLTVQAWSRAIDLSGKTVISIKKLFAREVSMNTLGGPIMIGKLAGDSMSRGVSQFLKVMALISISLAIFNMLPVPILDGGHIFLLLVEVVRGKPITIKQTEFIQQIGLSLIVLLLVVVLFNDLSRVGLPALRQMFQ